MAESHSSCAMPITRIDGRKNRGPNLAREHRPEWNSWRAMVARCCDPNYERYDLYGGRGIIVCERWRTFRNFLADMGPKPTRKHSIDRLDSDGYYVPGNCRWATHTEHMRNTSRSVMIEYQERTMSVQECAELAGISAKMIERRLREGWSPDDAISKPIRPAANDICIEGVSRSIVELAQISGLPDDVIRQRVKRGWSASELLNPLTRIHTRKRRTRN